MVGNIYGVDIKLSNSNGKLVPRGIEINGVDFGTDFFKYPGGDTYYRSLVRVLGEDTGGKPLFFHHDPLKAKKKHPYLRGHFQRTLALRTYREQKKFAGYLRDTLGPFHIDESWIRDWFEFVRKSSYKTEDEVAIERKRIKEAAEKEDIPVHFFTANAFIDRDHLTFLLYDGTEIKTTEAEVGAIWTDSDMLEFLDYYSSIVLNSHFIEELTDFKPLISFYAKFLNHKLQDFLPYGIPFGAGVNSPKEIIKFFESDSSDLVVKKRGRSKCGSGVFILTKSQALSYLRNLPEYQAGDVGRLISPFARVVYDNNKGIDNFVYSYESFIPSIGLKHPDGMLHDGCARVVIYVPSKGDPIYVGGQWRLAPSPLDDKDSSLEDRLRANLSRGALAVPLDHEHEGILSNYAVNFIKTFEDFRVKVSSLMDSISSVSARKLNLADVARLFFWAHYLRETVNVGIGTEEFRSLLIEEYAKEKKGKTVEVKFII